jgi:hypothetical protein
VALLGLGYSTHYTCLILYRHDLLPPYLYIRDLLLPALARIHCSCLLLASRFFLRPNLPCNPSLCLVPVAVPVLQYYATNPLVPHQMIPSYRCRPQSTAAKRRLIRDFKRLASDPPIGISGSPNTDNIMIWNAVIFGPRKSLASSSFLEYPRIVRSTLAGLY